MKKVNEQYGMGGLGAYEEGESKRMLRKVKGKWALVSREKQRPLAYYKGSGKPSPDWVDKQEKRVEYFKNLKEEKPTKNTLSVIRKVLKESTWKDEIHGGKADKRDPKDFDQEQLKIGMEVEREHTDDPHKAKEIAMDHLEEDPNYYKYLKSMEKKHNIS